MTPKSIRPAETTTMTTTLATRSTVGEREISLFIDMFIIRARCSRVLCMRVITKYAVILSRRGGAHHTVRVSPAGMVHVSPLIYVCQCAERCRVVAVADALGSLAMLAHVCDDRAIIINIYICYACRERARSPGADGLCILWSSLGRCAVSTS